MPPRATSAPAVSATLDRPQALPRPGDPDSRAGAAVQAPDPPCKATPDAWTFTVRDGADEAARVIRAAADGCGTCRLQRPDLYEACLAAPKRMRTPRTVHAGYVVTSTRRLSPVAHYIRVTLPRLKPLATDMIPEGEDQPRAPIQLASA